jgi:CheY-like chemotaxis protein
MFAFLWHEISVELNPLLCLAACSALLVLGMYIYILFRRKIRSRAEKFHGGRAGNETSIEEAARSHRFFKSYEKDANTQNWEDDKKDAHDFVVVQALSIRLKRLGFEVVQSPDAAHALMGAMKIHPDLIIMDINMPSGNGLAVAEMMASDPRYTKIPVIIHSAITDEASRERCKKLGIWYVEKSPKAWSEIKVIVSTLFEIKEKKSDPVETEKNLENIEKIDTKSLSDEAVERVTPLVPLCGRARIICIDSSEGELDLFESRLSALGVEVTKSHDLEEGFWTCFTEKPHAVIIQMAHEHKKLLEMLDRFIMHPFTKSIPIIFINHNNDIPQADLPVGNNFKVVDTPIAWHDFVLLLEKIVPISTPQDDDPLAKPVHGSKDTSAAKKALDTEPAAFSETAGEPTLRILCIDDDPVIAQSVAIRMKPYGIEVKGVLNGMTGYLQAIAERPDVVLLDMQIPNGDGHYVLDKLKEHPRTKDIPVIILTIETNQGVRRQMLSQGAAGFLSKPVRWNALFEELGSNVPLPSKAIEDYKLHHQLTESVS